MAGASMQVHLYPFHHCVYHGLSSPISTSNCPCCLDCFMQLQRAAKLLDSGAVRATKFLWRYPIARVILLFYLVRTTFCIVLYFKAISCTNGILNAPNYLTIFLYFQVFVHLFLMYLLHRLQVYLYFNDNWRGLCLYFSSFFPRKNGMHLCWNYCFTRYCLFLPISSILP